jgi:SecD/SecF fusion protein
MQGKGLVTAVFTLLVLACIYQLSFTWAASRTESKAKKYAQSQVASLGGDLREVEKDSLRLVYEENYLEERQNEKVLLWYTYGDCKSNELNLGLDLQGGMSVVMEVSKFDLIRQLARSEADPQINAALEAARLIEGRGEGEFIDAFVDSYEEQNPGGQLVLRLSTLDTDELDANSTNDQVRSYLKKSAEEGFNATLTKLRERIDRFGVAQASITPVEGQGRIIVELPGVDNPKQIKRLLQSTANLEFWEAMPRNQEVLDLLLAADERSKGLFGDAPVVEEEVPAIESLEEVAAEAEFGEFEAELEDAEEVVEEVLESAVAIVDPITGDTFPDSASLLAAQGIAPADEEIDPVSNPSGPLFEKLIFTQQQASAVAQVKASDTAEVMRMLNHEDIRPDFTEYEFAWGAVPVAETEDEFELYMLALGLEGEPLLEGDIIKSAGASFGVTGNVEVNMQMNAKGAQMWGEITTEMEAQGNLRRYVAVVLDNKVYSAPYIVERILNGSSRISGNFDLDEAQALASILETGKLPVRARIVQEGTVGPSLGRESINRGITALIIGLVLVLLFMVFYYSNSGLVADMALLANIFFVFGILSAWGATLTLPGLAGIVLTVGMAVDANVIIFERIREELSKGKSMLLAITDGYRNSYSAIIDANITTLIVALILQTFGLGPVKGFAIVLIIGILTSLFTAIFLTRLIIDRWTSGGRTVNFYTSFTEGAFKNINFDFVGRRKTFYTASGIALVLGIASFTLNGFTLGVDFKGGRTYTVSFDQAVNADEIRGTLLSDFDENVQVKNFSEATRLKITTAKNIEITTDEMDSTITANLFASLLPYYVDQQLSFDQWDKVYNGEKQKVLPSIAQDIQRSSVIAGLLALAGIFLYLFARFGRPAFGVGAIAAVLHDVIFVLDWRDIYRRNSDGDWLLH